MKTIIQLVIKVIKKIICKVLVSINLEPKKKEKNYKIKLLLIK